METISFLVTNVKPMEIMEYTFYLFKLIVLGCVGLGFYYAWTKIRGERGSIVHNHYYGGSKKK